MYWLIKHEQSNGDAEVVLSKHGTENQALTALNRKVEFLEVNSTITCKLTVFREIQTRCIT